MKAIILACCCVFTAVRPLVASPEATTANYVAHEWGTFTSVQGADGVQMEWNPLNLYELPGFVYSLFRPGLGRPTGAQSLSKTAFVARQRMETPVIYFYSDAPLHVNVAVDFPQGKLTEWYPQARFAEELEKPNGQTRLVRKQNTLRWNNLAVIPGTARGADTEITLPNGEQGSHYYAARETDAVLVATDDGSGKRENEKFLFYRGIGHFVAPLTVTTTDAAGATLLLANSSDEELRHLFAYEVRNGAVRSVFSARIGPREQTTVRLTDAPSVPLAEARGRIAGQLRDALAAEGLFPREAAAMVKTWDDSWLGEEGVRVLYVLPRAWTDRTLPLRITPAPRAIERVMVGRAEIITREMEMALEAEVARFASGDGAARTTAVKNTRNLGLGRFAEAALRRVMASGKRSKEFTGASWELLTAASAPPAPTAAP